jgi:hypothetical protein
MTRLAAGTTLVLLTLIGACGRDASSREVTAPDADGKAALVATAGGAAVQDDDQDSGPARVAIRDDCDPDDAAWNPTGGCALSRGSVTFAEFNTELSSTLGPTAVIGHPSWRNDPSYTVINQGQQLMVRNAGGRAHTFTEVANFGGGKVPNPALNKGLVQAPECPGSADIAAGGHAVVAGLGAGSHRFQCCIHPWMRAIVEVKAKQGR